MSEIINWKALDIKVLVVAIKHIRGRNRDTKEIIYAWSAYIKDTPGDNHERELERVKAYGNKLSEKIALAIFPMYEGTPYAY